MYDQFAPTEMPRPTPPDRRPTELHAGAHHASDTTCAAFREQERGAPRADRLADVVVVSEDIIGADSHALLTEKPVRTVMGGRDTFRRTP